jgi:hypothetical protein
MSYEEIKARAPGAAMDMVVMKSRAFSTSKKKKLAYTVTQKQIKSLKPLLSKRPTCSSITLDKHNKRV